MKERLLCKCRNNITANSVVNLLDANGIVLRQHDETIDQRTGAYGPNPGIAIYVFEKDYEKALMLVAPIINYPPETSKPFCPKCGSENTTAIRRYKYITLIVILSVLFLIVPCLYFYYSKEWNIKSVAMDCVAATMVLLSIILMIIYRYKNVNYMCNNCSKKFNHI
ncbi:MAG: DUF2007 domain-containing protein [Bacteroidales bacterium]|nr:DUF2007 domain-containing protein [Bacteroidales bacterium]